MAADFSSPDSLRCLLFLLVNFFLKKKIEDKGKSRTSETSWPMSLCDVSSPRGGLLLHGYCLVLSNTNCMESRGAFSDAQRALIHYLYTGKLHLTKTLASFFLQTMIIVFTTRETNRQQVRDSNQPSNPALTMDKKKHTLCPSRLIFFVLFKLFAIVFFQNFWCIFLFRFNFDRKPLETENGFHTKKTLLAVSYCLFFGKKIISSYILLIIPVNAKTKLELRYQIISLHLSFCPSCIQCASNARCPDTGGGGGGGGFCLFCTCVHLLPEWGLCALRHGIQISMEAILACHLARSTEWLDCHPKSCELWRIRTGPICFFFFKI